MIDRVRALIGLTATSLDATTHLGRRIVDLEADLAAAQRDLTEARRDLSVQRTVNAHLEEQTKKLGPLRAQHDASEAEVLRLAALLARADPQQRACSCGPGAAYWRQQAELHQANAHRLEDRLAAREGRPSLGSLK